MQLVLIRHGIAEDQEEFAATGQDDALRPLTKQGRWKMERIAHGLRRVASALDILASSPLRRAQQTAKIVAGAYGGIEVTTVPALAPETPLAEVLAWLRRQPATATLAAVGHEPHLGELATWLLTGRTESRIEFRKGGACELEFDGRPNTGTGRLIWALTPAVLRGLAD
jgi:phosphohistidine phosphatase